jgi:triosephosphate isomerase
MSSGRPVVGVSLKAYFDRTRAVAWAEEVAALARRDRWTDAVEVFVLPDYLSIPAVISTLAETGIAVGAQDVSAHGYGATTGDVPAARLADEGCTLAAVGHAERRRLHAETDEIVARKLAQVTMAGLTPVLCIGEDRPGVDAARDICRRQLDAAGAPRLEKSSAGRERTDVPRTGVGANAGRQRIIVAYEPVWAIGADQPAATDYVLEVVDSLRASHGRCGDMTCEFVYGGSARPGLLTELGDGVDGVFLGRFAHDPSALAAVVAEAARRAATNPS